MDEKDLRQVIGEVFEEKLLKFLPFFRSTVKGATNEAIRDNRLTEIATTRSRRRAGFWRSRWDALTHDQKIKLVGASVICLLVVVVFICGIPLIVDILSSRQAQTDVQLEINSDPSVLVTYSASQPLSPDAMSAAAKAIETEHWRQNQEAIVQSVCTACWSGSYSHFKHYDCREDSHRKITDHEDRVKIVAWLLNATDDETVQISETISDEMVRDAMIDFVGMHAGDQNEYVDNINAYNQFIFDLGYSWGQVILPYPPSVKID